MSLLELLSPQATARGRVNVYSIQPTVRIEKYAFAQKVPQGETYIYAESKIYVDTRGQDTILDVYVLVDPSSPSRIWYYLTDIYFVKRVYYKNYVPNDGSWHRVASVDFGKSSMKTLVTHYARFDVAGTYTLGIGYSVRRRGMAYTYAGPEVFTLTRIRIPPYVTKIVIPVVAGIGIGVGIYELVRHLRKR